MFRVLFIFLLVALSAAFTLASLLFPASSVLQITSSVTAPILIPGRKLFWDWGLQMNYDFPSKLTQFYNVPIWPDTFENRKRRETTNEAANQTAWHKAEKYQTEDLNKPGKHPNDFTAGELYHSFENLLVSYGFHETCMLRSVCELARHPFADEQRNILSEVLTFVMTPSLHEAFSESEPLYREVYEEAERRGFLHYNCADLYHECKQDLLTAITTIITNVEYMQEDENKTKTKT